MCVKLSLGDLNPNPYLLLYKNFVFIKWPPYQWYAILKEES